MSDEPQGGMGWLLPWAENNLLNQAFGGGLWTRASALGGGRKAKTSASITALPRAMPFFSKKYAAELVGLTPDVILASASSAVEALKLLTRSIRIVFAAVADPVEQGFVRSLDRPGGNIGLERLVCSQGDTKDGPRQAHRGARQGARRRDRAQTPARRRLDATSSRCAAAGA
jgi:hypothetical protein